MFVYSGEVKHCRQCVISFVRFRHEIMEVEEVRLADSTPS